MRIIFLGTPEFAVPTLEKLIAWPEAEVVAVLTQPDRPAGRGNRVFAPPTKMVAAAHKIPVFQPERLSKAPDVVQAMRDLKPDILVTVAFGQILKKDVLELAPMGVVNLHGSLLPRYRGAAPINWAVINGEKVSGNTTMFSDVGVDTGQMLLKQEVPVGEDMTAEELAHILSLAGADLMIDTLGQLKNGTLKGTEQDSSLATMAPRLTKEMGIIDWNKPAQQIHNLVRGLCPWPGTQTQSAGVPLKIITTRLHKEKSDSVVQPGTLLVSGHHILVACAEGELLELVTVQPANKGKMAAADWANGARIKTGMSLGQGS